MQGLGTVNGRRVALAWFSNHAKGQMMLRRITPLLPACAALVLSACATNEGTYPSLAKRPGERISATWPPAPPAPEAPPPPLDPASLNRLDGLLAHVRSADARFHAKEGRARSLVAAAGRAPMGSEAWSVATVAVSELEAARAEAMVAMSELDSLYVSARTEGRDVTQIDSARNQALAIIGQQDRVLDSLKGKLDR